MQNLYYRPCDVKALLEHALVLYRDNNIPYVLDIYEYILSFSKDKHVRNICYKNLFFLIERGFSPLLSHLPSALQYPLAPKFPLTMTTCKRLALFERTIRSFFAHVDRCCIDHLYLFDDGSTASDIHKMHEILDDLEISHDFIVKSADTRGHPQSVNQIRALMINQSCPFFVHLEDDFDFFVSYPLIRTSAEVLFQFPQYGQCLFNNSYKEERADFCTLPWGQQRLTESGTVFYEHVWKDPNNPHGYWPGFSLRPGLNCVQTWQEMGEVIERGSFEKDYATRWATAGWKVAYLESSCCEHIGRKTSEKSDPSKTNAYVLNGGIQFDNFAWKAVCLDDIVARVKLADEVSGLFLRDFQEQDDARATVAHVKIWLELIAEFKQNQAVLVSSAPCASELWVEPYYKLNGFDPWDVLFLSNMQFLNNIVRCSASALDKIYLLNYTGAQKLLAYVENEGIQGDIRALMESANLVMFKAI